MRFTTPFSIRGNYFQTGVLLVILLSFMTSDLFSQVKIPFKQRTSKYSPSKKIYNIKGDFAMIGNTNLTLVNYGDLTENGDHDMRYVDVDDNLNTFNSSSATLNFSTETGAIPECSNIIYAGLYWTGRASKSGYSSITFPVVKTLTTPPQQINNDQKVGNKQKINNTNYTINIYRFRNIVRYSFQKMGVSVDFEFQDTSPYIRYRINYAAWIIPENQVVTDNGNIRKVTFDPITVKTSPEGMVIKLTGLERDLRTNRPDYEYTSTSYAYVNITGTKTTTTLTKHFDKRMVYLKGPGASDYTSVKAKDSDIYYPTTTDAFIYSAYTEVTDYVKQHGLGEYTVADIATVEGIGGKIGYNGGWGLIVIYENSKMKNRAITVFDGYGYIQGLVEGGHELPVSGFTTVQNGSVNLKLGIMTSEGDRGITGDYFSIKKQSDNTWLDLSHDQNTSDNFFNSSVVIDGSTKNPDLMNNTGIDISAFNIPNPDNSVITNNQTSTVFRYGSTGDKYTIFLIAMAVDAYIPELEAESTVSSIGGIPTLPGPQVAFPGQEIEYKIKLYNKGIEAINDVVLNIPVPFMASYVPDSVNGSLFFDPLPTPNNLIFDPDKGALGSIVWNIGTLPIPENVSDLLGELTFKFKVTEDCRILKNSSCIPAVVINGTSNGIGEISGISVIDKAFMQANTSDSCPGQSTTAPLSVTLMSQAYNAVNCQDTPDVLGFDFCNAPGPNVLSQIAQTFMPGTSFSSGLTTFFSIFDNIFNPLPTVLDGLTFVASLPGGGCKIPFRINVGQNQIITAPPSYVVEGCNTNAITGLTYSETPVSISLPQYLFAGGFTSTPLLKHTISYVDTKTGTCPLVVTRTFTITTVCAANQTYVQYITVADTTPPAVPIAPADIAISGSSEIPEMISLTANDSCSGAVTVEGHDATLPGSCPYSSTIVRTWTFTDECGNTSSVSQNIIMNDTIAPVAPVAPDDVTVTCSTEVPEMIRLTATDNYSGEITVEGHDVITPGSCPNSYTIVRTWTFTDECGNTSEISQNITVNDDIAPVVPSIPGNITVACSAETLDTIHLTAQDNCSGEITVEGQDIITPGSCPNSYTIIRTWTFIDECGNTSEVSQNITVNDDIAPVAPTAPENSTVSCSAEVPAMIRLTANDNCSGEITVEGQDVITPGSCPNNYTIVRTWTFTDDCGNTSEVSQNITVNDDIAPVAPTAPENSTVSCSAEVPAMIRLTATDNCSGEITVEGLDLITPGSCPNSYTIVRTWTFTDECGNTSDVSQNITIHDDIAPTFTAPQAITIYTDTSCNYDASVAITGDVTDENDNCSTGLQAVYTDAIADGSCTGSKIITRTWTLTDQCDNTTDHIQIITVLDNIAPIIETPAQDITVVCDGHGNHTELQNWLNTNGGAVANDNCSSVTWNNDFNSLGNNCSDSVTVIFTATDACGNTATTQATFIVNDTIAPVAPIAPSDITVTCSTEVPAMINLTAQDNCSGEMTVEGQDIITPGSCPNNYTIVRTWTFTDDCGNTSEVSQNIIVNDNVAPVTPIVPSDITIACSTEVPAMINLTATDNCSGEMTVEGQDIITPGSCPNNYTIVRTWTFTDDCGNTSDVSQNIIVNDNVAPVTPIVPSDITIACSTEVPAMIRLTANDNCSGEITVEGQDIITPGSCPNNYTIVRTWTFTDDCGNTSDVSQNITVNDNVAPVTPIVPSDITIACSTEIPAMINLTAQDNCSGEITVEGQDTTTPGSCPNNYTIVRTWTFTDECGNTSEVSQNITVNDNLAPVTPIVPSDITIACSAEIPAMISLTATDNCSGEITVEGLDVITPGSCPNSYIIIRTWTFTDTCGNASEVSQNITVKDNIAPVVLKAPTDMTVSCSSHIPPMTRITARDNCSGKIIVPGEDEITPGNCPNSYVLTRTWTFVDDCGNTTKHQQVITVLDNIAPTLVTPYVAEISTDCTDIPIIPELEFTDNCDTTVLVDYSENITNETLGHYTVVRTWKASDVCFNSETYTQTVYVTVNDPLTILSKSICIKDEPEDLFDVLPEGILQSGTWSTTNAGAALEGNIFNPSRLEPGNYTVRYTLTGEDCPLVFEINIELHSRCLIINIYNAISLNNDGNNDLFYIEGIKYYPHNNVTIYNRWGKRVFSTDGYDNTTRAFRGISEGNAVFNRGAELPDGTYFYILKYMDDSDTEHTQTGYLYLTR